MGSGSFGDLTDQTGAAMPSKAAPDLGDMARKARAKTLLGASLKQGSASTYLTGSRGVREQPATPKTVLGA